MPFKDAVEHLAEAASSVLGQTYEHCELLLVDDGGTDGSTEVAAALAGAEPSRVRVLAHAGRVNRGTGPSRALGITSARGALTAFLDADDRWDAGHLEHEVRLLQASPDAALVCGRTWYWRSWADPRAVDTLSPLAFAPGVVVPPPRLLAAVLRQGALTTATCSLLAPTEALRAAVGPLAGFPGCTRTRCSTACCCCTSRPS
jgi:glycosyltransferase involved in cell wall biosynthesis